MKRLILLPIILLAGCQTPISQSTTQGSELEPLDPDDPPPKISVMVKSVELVPESPTVVTKMVFVWREMLSDSVYALGDLRKGLQVGQKFDCLIWESPKESHSRYVYRWNGSPDDVEYLLFFPKEKK